MAMKGTAANYAAYEGAKRTAGALNRDVDIDESVDYVLDDVLGPGLDDLLDEDLDPRLRALLTDRLEQSLSERLDPDSQQWMSDTNTVIARRIAEHHAYEAIFPQYETRLRGRADRPRIVVARRRRQRGRGPSGP